MPDKIGTSTLGPIHIEPQKLEPMRAAYEEWWRALTRKGDPLRISDLAWQGFRAGWQSALTKSSE